MTTQGILPSIFIVLIFAFLLDAKSIDNIRTKRAPNFFAYPRQGRASFLHYPRMGRRASWGDSVNDLSDSESAMCCTKGVRVAYSLNDVPVMYCKADRCCEGLVERTYFTQLGDEGISMVVDCSAQQDEVFGSSGTASES